MRAFFTCRTERFSVCHWSLFALLLGAIVGCGVTETVVVETGATEVPLPTSWSDVETIDMSQYPDTPVNRDRTVVHDVPAILMNSAADDGILEKVDGFRIQVFSSADRGEAAQKEEEVRQWILGLSPDRRRVLGLSEDPEVYSFYKQPYYRVRVGDFLTRALAQPIVNAMKSNFPGALIVPDVIEVLR
jgi:hypothetical protein